MNRYLMIRRLRGPLFLLLIGVLALLHQADILRWHQSWPLFLIYFGVFMLAERAALSFDDHQNANAFASTPADYTTTGNVGSTGADETISTHSSDTTTRGVQL